jgi:protoporphyrin/coproporphyrin ferrochelatase
MLLGHMGSRKAIGASRERCGTGAARGPGSPASPAVACLPMEPAPGRPASHTPGVVHAPGRSEPARVPGRAGRGQHPRGHPAARPGHGDHPAAGAPLRRRRRRAVQRHRRARPCGRLRDRRRPGHRSGGRAPLRTADDLDRSDRSSRRRRRVRHRDRGAVGAELPFEVPLLAFAGAPFTVASYLIEGRPSRTYQPHQAVMHTDRPVAPGHGAAGPARRRVHHQPAPSGRPAPTSCSTRGRARCPGSTTTLRAAPYSRDVFRRSPTRFPTLRRSTSASAAITSWSPCTKPRPRHEPGDRPRLAHPHRRGPPTARRRHRGAGQPRPGAGARRRRRGVRRRRCRARRQRPTPASAIPATCSTWATACSPTPIPVCSSSWSPRSTSARHGSPNEDQVDEHVTPSGTPSGTPSDAVLLMAYGTPRTPTRSSRTTPTSVGVGHPPRSSWPTWWRATRPSGASRPSPNGPSRSGAPSSISSTSTNRAATRWCSAEARRSPRSRSPSRTGPAGLPAASSALVLAPHFSSYSIGQYVGRARDAAAPHGIEVLAVESWAVEPAFVALPRRRPAAPGWRDAPELQGAVHRPLAPPAHHRRGDPVPRRAAGHGRGRGRPRRARPLEPTGPWRGSRPGRTPEPWIGPDILEVIDDLAASENADGVIVCACGFVADHLEVLYDLDIEARPSADQRGWPSTARPASTTIRRSWRRSPTASWPRSRAE